MMMLDTDRTTKTRLLQTNGANKKRFYNNNMRKLRGLIGNLILFYTLRFVFKKNAWKQNTREVV